MTTEATLYGDLSGDAGLTALVSTRIYPNVLSESLNPQTPGHWPAIAFRVVSAVRIGGRCVRRRHQVDIYGDSYGDVRDVRDALKTLADGKAAWEYIEGPDLYEEDTQLHHKVVDLVIS